MSQPLGVESENNDNSSSANHQATKQDQLEFIRQKCVEANPDI
jgi:hypothetical protein